MHPDKPEVVIGKDGLEIAKPTSTQKFCVILMENGPEGDRIVETVYEVQENEVKYATARLVDLAQASAITCYSIEVKEDNE
jgi:hypothetical protein